MDDLKKGKLWQFKAITSMVFVYLSIIILLIAVALVRKLIEWPSKESENIILTGIFIISLLPIIFIIIDIVIERGGKIEYGGIKIDFSEVHQKEPEHITIPNNIGVPGQAVTDSSTTQILDSLKDASINSIVVIDLEDGKAWWETRLLVLLSGATRIGKPQIFVFIGTDGGVIRKFLGWGYARELLGNLLQMDKQYQLSYYSALAASKQWEMVEPEYNWYNSTSIQQGLAAKHTGMAFENGIPNKHFAEQLLASDLGQKIEILGLQKLISISNLNNIFGNVLHKQSIDELWPNEQQTSTFFNTVDEYIAITQNGAYKTLLSKLDGLNAILKSMAGSK